MARPQRRDSDDPAFRIYFNSLAGALFRHESVTVRKAFATEHLWALADVVPHFFALARDFADTGRFAAVSVEHVTVRQDLEEDRDARGCVFPDHLASGVQFEEAIRPLAIFEEHQPMLDIRISSNTTKRRKHRQGNSGNGLEKCHSGLRVASLVQETSTGRTGQSACRWWTGLDVFAGACDGAGRRHRRSFFDKTCSGDGHGKSLGSCRPAVNLKWPSLSITVVCQPS